MTVRVFSDQAGTTAAAANDNIGKVEDLSKFDSDGVSSTTGPYLSVDANGFGSADILTGGGDVVQTFTNAISDGSALVVGTSKCIFFSHVNVEAGGTLTIGPAGDLINTNGLNLIGKVVSVATTTKVLTTAEQTSIATFFAERGASSVVVNDETVYDVNSVEADLVLDFTGDSFYRNVPHYFKLGGTYSTFADAFTGTSPKLTYSTAAGSNSTMVNSAGEIVWAPHNLALNSATPATQTIAVRSGAQYTVRVTGTGSMALSGAGTGTATDGSPVTITASTTSLTITLTGSLDTVAVYRSDLGGMAQVPGAATGFEYYVPTNGNPEYLPRVGHHVYNGSAWVNEGLLIESEARTNLVTYSVPDNTNWTATNNPTVTINDATSPDGGTNATSLLANGTAGFQQIVKSGITLADNTDYALSIFFKAAVGNSGVRLALTNNAGNTVYFSALSDGTAGPAASLNPQITPVGNGWFRASCVINSASGATSPSVRLYVTDSAGQVGTLVDGDGIYIWGAQLEQGEAIPNTNPVQYKDAPTPSSYMPTNGGTYTRTAQSLTVPPAQFGWPEPEYIGPELVDNNDFSLGDNGDWTLGTGWSISGGVASITNPSSTSTYIQQDIGGVSDKFYLVTLDIISLGISGIEVRAGANASGEGVKPFTSTGTQSAVVKWTGTGGNLYIRGIFTSGTYTIDNISVREINPLSVSIQMDGRMTNLATTSFDASELVRWRIDANNLIDLNIDTLLPSLTGQVRVRQRANGGTYREVKSSGTAYTDGIFTPFNISSRHGSTFIRGATDGVLTNLDTTPTALPDLSGTNLQIAYDFMGTIGQFRQFAGDIGDTGLVTATNPSTEPTLSLTFDGTNGSFYNLSWSE